MDEFTLHKQVAEYLRLQYPDMMFLSDFGGVKLPVGHAKKLKQIRDGRPWPDLFLAEPRGKWHGLFVELKRDDNEVFTKAGELRQSAHIMAQNAMLTVLVKRGYCAMFGCGFDDAKEIVDSYLKGGYG